MSSVVGVGEPQKEGGSSAGCFVNQSESDVNIVVGDYSELAPPGDVGVVTLSIYIPAGNK